MNSFFGVGPLELLVIGVLAMVVIGPDKLPGAIRQIMRTVRELRAYAETMRDELAPFQEEMRREFSELSGEMEAITKDLTDATNEATASVNGIVAETQSVVTETQQSLDVRPAVNELMAPLPPRDSSIPLSPPSAVSTNGTASIREDEPPPFVDYRPA